MLKVGLTGSIAVGKTYVCDVFSKLGCAVLDADNVAREVVRQGTEGLRLIKEHFGDEVLLESGELDRGKLGSIIFGDESKRQLLNSIIHPLVIDAQDLWIAKVERENTAEIAIVDAALMIESGSYVRFDKIIVVWCRPEIQLRRLMLRDNIDESAARKKVDAQLSQAEKKEKADFLIDTSDGFESARENTKRAHQALISLLSE